MATKLFFTPDLFEGKVVLLTGGGSGIGLEMSTYFGKYGAKIAIMGRRNEVLDDAVKQLAAQGIKAIGIQGDVRNKDDCSRVVETTVGELGRLDVLVNGAAGNFLCAAEDLSPNAFKTVIDIDTVGTYQMCSAALHYLKKGGQGKQPDEGGAILNISATLHYTASWYQIHVSAAKAAVDSITRSLALEWGTDFGIRVNGIAPGPIRDTPGMDKLSVDFDERIAKNVPLGRYGDKHDIANCALFICSEAGGYINGATVPVDGGNWLTKVRMLPNDVIRSFSRAKEQNRKKALAQSKL